MAERFITRTALGFHVIEAVKLNDKPLTKAKADRLARSRVAAAPPPPEEPPQVDALGSSRGRLRFYDQVSAMVVERDADFEPWPAAPDPVREAIGRLLVAIIEGTAPGSRERAKAMTEALQAHERISARWPIDECSTERTVHAQLPFFQC
jgi:hypothetical protein